MFKLPQYTWDKDRELCKKCKHYREQPDASGYNGGGVVMRCAVNPFKGIIGIGTCIDNRTRGPCGKEGRLFETIGPVPNMAVYTGRAEIVIPLVQEELAKRLRN